MIEYPDQSWFPLILTFIGLIIMFLNFLNQDSNKWVISCMVIGAVITVVSFSIQYSDTSTSDWKEQVIAEIENTPCESLPTSYDFYNEHSTEIGEKIKTKYVFECVSDKEDSKMLLEMMK